MKITKLATLTIAAALVVSGCQAASPEGPDQSVKPSPSVTLSVPETSTAGKRVQVVVEAAGLVGTEAVLYQFSAGFTGDKPTCQTEPRQQVAVRLVDGPQVVEVPVESPGDLWFVLRAGDLATSCGAERSVTRALMTPRPEVRLENGATMARGKITYQVGVSEAPPDGIAWEVKTLWFGPYATVPDAEAATCPKGEQAAEGVTRVDKASGSNGDGQRPTTVQIAESGVYRVAWEVARTPWSVPVDIACGESALLTVQ